MGVSLPEEASEKTHSTPRDTPVPRQKIVGGSATPTFPSSPNERIRRALEVLDFTTLHSEALSADHMQPPHSKEPVCLDAQYLTPESSASSQTSDMKSSKRGRGYDKNSTTHSSRSSSARGIIQHNSSSNDLPLPIGAVFDPLWDPAITKRAAVNAYAMDLHQEMLRNAGLLDETCNSLDNFG